MSLFVLNSSSRPAQGLIRHLYRRGGFERIVCGDLYPTYFAIENWLRFKEQLEGIDSKTKVTDVQISDKSDLLRAINESQYFLYVTHQYYQNVPSKLNLLENSAKIAKDHKGLKKFIAVTPAELDHYGETDPQQAAIASEEKAKAACPSMIHIKSDITVGKDAQLWNDMVKYLATGTPFTIPTNQASVHPVYSGDIHLAVDAALNSDKVQPGQTYLAKGTKPFSFHGILELAEKATGKKLNTNESLLKKIFPPNGISLISEQLYCPSTINTARLLQNYKSIEGTKYIDLKEIIPQVSNVEDKIKEGSINVEEVAAQSKKNCENYLYKRVFY